MLGGCLTGGIYVRKYIISFFLIFFIITNSIFYTFGTEENNTNKNAVNLEVDAKSAVIMEPITGKILFQKNQDEMLAPASVTKIMTLLLIYESVAQKKISWDDLVTVSEHASSMGGSQIFLEPNEKQKVSELTKSIAIASANDAAVAMAEFIGGSEDGFVDMMNRRAKELGMNNTVFKNACGLDTDGHLMSAKDIAIMSRELIHNYPDVKKYTTTWQDTITHSTRKGDTEFGLTNTNKLIKWYNGATGLKTGSTGNAMYCLSGTAERNGMELIAVVMAAPDPKIRFKEVMKMLDYGFANYMVVKGNEQNSKAGDIPVYKGKENTVCGVVKDEIKIVVPKGSSTKIEAKPELLSGIMAPFPAGEKVGEVVYFYEGKEVGKSDVVTEKNVEKAGLNDILKRLVIMWFS